MALIKSALELALENTAGIEGDREAIKRKEIQEKGRKIASKFLFDPEGKGEELAKALKEQKKEERPQIEDAALTVFLSNISLPRTDVDEDLLEKIGEGLSIVTGEKKRISTIVKQLGQFLSQYIQNRDKIVEELKKQFAPQLEAKEKALSRQYGRAVHLEPEQDPEFMQHLNHNLGRLEQQYQQALDQAKKELASMK
jgi:hypothetical protein